MPDTSGHVHYKPVDQFQPPADDKLNIGFRQYRLKEDYIYDSMYKDCNQIFFLLEGQMVVNSSEALGKIVSEGEFFFLPTSADMSCKALSPCNFLVFFFDRLINTCDRAYFRELWGLCSQMEYKFKIVAMRHPLLDFAHSLITHFSQLIDVSEYQHVKYEEFLYLLRSVYSKEEMAAIFYPIAGKSIDFRKFVMENYLKVKNIHGLVSLSGLKRKTFDRQFFDEFGQPPYQWVLKQKAKHIRYALSETNDQMQEIMKKYGFVIAPHFTRFCKDYFKCTPLELRKRLRMEKLQLGY
ncbi:MAG: AraC family transcriptional regulator [Tannerellaceae bacterium]|jgi:AraC-like DNA-binding protein|nr:AraC family transcriptional regulator [Tannerellaceae bacterium]